MYILNKIVWFFLNPAMLVLAGGILGLILVLRGRGNFRRVGVAMLMLVLLFFWFMSSAVGVRVLGRPLESPYFSQQRPEDVPSAGAIVALGGGIGKSDELVYPEMFDGADRLWHAARLYHAGKAPLVVVSGSNDLEAAVPLLLDLGVPRAAIAVDNKSRNTYENSRFTERLLAGLPARTNEVDALVVTSAWHMPRALGNFSRTHLRCAPAPCDFKTYGGSATNLFLIDWIAPSSDAFLLTSVFAKEWVGRLARK